jgi:cell division protein ZipA
MMHEPMLLIALAVLVGLAAMLLMNGARKRRLKVKIEPVPTERLDNTPVRSEILSEVRVRERAHELRLENEKNQAAHTDAESELASEPIQVRVSGLAVEPELSPIAQPEVEAAPVVKLSQADLFPEEILTPKVPAAETLESSALDLAIDRVFSIHVMATTQLFEGRQLLELLLQYGLRFGDMDIFHRHEHPTGQGDILFSMAQAVEPGTFNIDSLSRDLVPGVSFFMSLPGKKSTLAFDLMTDTARRLAYELQADLLDANSQVLTQAELDQWREAVVSYERQQYQSL